MSDKDIDQTAHDGGHGEEAVYPYTPHHFNASKHHFESGKMGVWLFLVTEILFFSGLFCAYTIYRGLHPEVFYWAHFYLDTTMGAINTIVLIFSSFTAAWAVRNAQLGQKGLLKINILITIACAFVFMGVKYVEYSHKFHDGLLPSGHFDPKHEVWETPSFKKQHPASAEAAVRIVEGLQARKNKQAAAHDEVAGSNDALRLVPVANETKVAAPSAAPASTKKGSTAATKAAPTTTKAAPAKKPTASPSKDKTQGAGSVEAPKGEPKLAVKAGGDEASSNKGETPTAAELEEGSMLGLLKADAEGKLAPAAEKAPAPVASAAEVEISDELWLYRQLRALSEEELHPLERAGVISHPADGPLEFSRPARAGVFFSIYFFMTGLHGFHVVVGIGLWIWMLSIASRRKMGRKYFGPIEYTALYWHLVDLIWIYLFPLLYLIH